MKPESALYIVMAVNSCNPFDEEAVLSSDEKDKQTNELKTTNAAAGPQLSMKNDTCDNPNSNSNNNNSNDNLAEPLDNNNLTKNISDIQSCSNSNANDTAKSAAASCSVTTADSAQEDAKGSAMEQETEKSSTAADCSNTDTELKTQSSDQSEEGKGDGEKTDVDTEASGTSDSSKKELLNGDAVEDNVAPPTVDEENIEEDFTEDRFRVDRRNLEQMLQAAADGKGQSGEEFFSNIMEKTGAKIAWPSKIKIGAKSKKDPHVKVSGTQQAVAVAKELIMRVLDTKSTRVTLKMDVAHTEHSHVIGKGGNNVRRVMDDTGCHIHFPDSNRTNAAEKSNQVSIAGQPAGVEGAREKIRALLPVVISFDLTVSAAMPDPNSPTIQRIVQVYGIGVQFKQRAKAYCTTTCTIRGSSDNLQGLMEGTRKLMQHLIGSTMLHVSSQMEVAPQQHAYMVGRNANNVNQIIKHTGAQIRFPDPNSLPRKSIVISGPVESVIVARQQLMGCLPLVLMFDVKNDEEITGAQEAERNNRLMEELDIFISVKLKPRQPSKSVIVKSVERNVQAMFEARRRMLGLDSTGLKPTAATNNGISSSTTTGPTPPTQATHQQQTANTINLMTNPPPPTATPLIRLTQATPTVTATHVNPQYIGILQPNGVTTLLNGAAVRHQLPRPPPAASAAGLLPPTWPPNPMPNPTTNPFPTAQTPGTLRAQQQQQLVMRAAQLKAAQQQQHFNVAAASALLAAASINTSSGCVNSLTAAAASTQQLTSSADPHHSTSSAPPHIQVSRSSPTTKEAAQKSSTSSTSLFNCVDNQLDAKTVAAAVARMQQQQQQQRNDNDAIKKAFIERWNHEQQMNKEQSAAYPTSTSVTTQSNKNNNRLLQLHNKQMGGKNPSPNSSFNGLNPVTTLQHSTSSAAAANMLSDEQQGAISNMSTDELRAILNCDSVTGLQNGRSHLSSLYGHLPTSKHQMDRNSVSPKSISTALSDRLMRTGSPVDLVDNNRQQKVDVDKLMVPKPTQMNCMSASSSASSIDLHHSLLNFHNASRNKNSSSYQQQDPAIGGGNHHDNSYLHNNGNNSVVNQLAASNNSELREMFDQQSPAIPPGFERIGKQSHDQSQLMNDHDYEWVKKRAFELMKRQPVADKMRTPTDQWSGLGFSQSMPNPKYKNAQKYTNELETAFEGEDMATAYAELSAEMNYRLNNPQQQAGNTQQQRFQASMGGTTGSLVSSAASGGVCNNSASSNTLAGQLKSTSALLSWRERNTPQSSFSQSFNPNSFNKRRLQHSTFDTRSNAFINHSLPPPPHPNDEPTNLPPHIPNHHTTQQRQQQLHQQNKLLNTNNNEQVNNNTGGGKQQNLESALSALSEQHLGGQTNTTGVELRDVLIYLNLDKYMHVFTNQEVDLQTFLTLNDSDLTELGITAFGPRKKILLAIEELKKHRSRSTPTSAILNNGQQLPTSSAPVTATSSSSSSVGLPPLNGGTHNQQQQQRTPSMLDGFFNDGMENKLLPNHPTNNATANSTLLQQATTGADSVVATSSRLLHYSPGIASHSSRW